MQGLALQAESMPAYVSVAVLDGVSDAIRPQAFRP